MLDCYKKQNDYKSIMIRRAPRGRQESQTGWTTYITHTYYAQVLQRSRIAARYFDDHEPATTRGGPRWPQESQKRSMETYITYACCVQCPPKLSDRRNIFQTALSRFSETCWTLCCLLKSSTSDEFNRFFNLWYIIQYSMDSIDSSIFNQLFNFQ